MQETTKTHKPLFAIVSIALSAASLVIGFLFRKPFMNSMSLGFLSMCATVVLGAMAS